MVLPLGSAVLQERGDGRGGGGGAVRVDGTVLDRAADVGRDGVREVVGVASG